MRLVILLLLLSAGMGLAGCGSSPSESTGINVIATTPALGDIAENVLGAQGTIEVLIPVAADPHSFQPSVRQAAALREADLVIANGLDLEATLVDLLETVVDDGGRVLEVGPLVDPIPFRDAPGTVDPHVWLDPIRGQRIAEIIAGELSALVPSGADEINSNLSEYVGNLELLHAQISDQLAPIQNRHLVTNHDALGYFATRYDLEIVGTIIPSGSTLNEPSARDLANLVDVIEQFEVSAIFAESTSPARLATALADEADRPVSVVELYTGSLGPEGSGAQTYMDMLALNAARIAEALS